MSKRTYIPDTKVRVDCDLIFKLFREQEEWRAANPPTIEAGKFGLPFHLRRIHSPLFRKVSEGNWVCELVEDVEVCGINVVLHYWGAGDPENYYAVPPHCRPPAHPPRPVRKPEFYDPGGYYG